MARSRAFKDLVLKSLGFRLKIFCSFLVNSFVLFFTIHPAFDFSIILQGVLLVVKTGTPTLKNSKITIPKFSLYVGNKKRSYFDQTLFLLFSL